MRFLVTGGAGFIGSNLVRHLWEQRDRVERIVTLDALTYSGNRENLADLKEDSRHVFIHGDIADRQLVSSLLDEHRIQAVVHLAAETHVDRSITAPDRFVETNVVGTSRLLEAVRSYWSGLAGEEGKTFRFLHVSTDEVFGALGPSDAPFHESTPYRPRSPYAASKAASDHFVRAYGTTYGLPILMTNSSNNYGPWQFPEKLIPLMILNLLEDRALPVYGDGLQSRDWLHVKDHCHALQLIVEKGQPGETYVVGGNCEVRNIDLVRQICEVIDGKSPRKDGRPHAVNIRHVADRPGHDRRYAVATDKIFRELGWRPQETLRTGLEATIEWYLDHRSWSDAISARIYNRERLGIL